MSVDVRVALLVDCENAQPAALDYAMQCAARSGRVVLKRGYGNHAALANRWQDAMVRMGLVPCLQYQYASGKNTADIALALDALEALLDRRADSFVIVTSDADFVHLCHKLRERGAAVRVVGEDKTPDALRNACDQFFEFVPARPVKPAPAVSADCPAQEPATAAAVLPIARARPQFIIKAVMHLAAGKPDGKVHLGELGNYLAGQHPGFLKKHGYPKLIDMLRDYPALELAGQDKQAWTVRMKSQAGHRAA